MTAHVYTVNPRDPGGHLLEVSLTIANPDPNGQVLTLPAWIPGSYLIRDFARHIVSIRAAMGDDPVELTKTDKSTWQAAPCDGPLTVVADVYAWDMSVRGAHFDTTHCYFNGTSLFLNVEGQEDEDCEVTLLAPEFAADWRVATSMRRKDAEPYGFGTYHADNYDELIDHPVEIGDLVVGEFEAAGIPHSIAIYGQHKADMGRICSDMATLCSAHHELLGTPEGLDRYVFLLTVLGSGYGGLEHRWSSSLVCSRKDLPRRDEEKISDGYRKFLGLVSHEYFHLWNVKRLKPSAFTPYELSSESYTGLLWVFEGITSYYDDLVLVRSGLITTDSYLELLGQVITRVIRGSGRLLQSVEESSFDAWTKFYRQEANASNAIVSYYAKGSLVALALDLHLRAHTDGQCTLDDVMRECWKQFAAEGMPERGLESVASRLSGVELSDFFERYVRGTADLPLDKFFAEFGIRVHLRRAEGRSDAGGKPGKKADAKKAWLGATLTVRNGQNVFSVVHAGSPAEKAGIAAGDIAVAIDNLRLTRSNLEERLGDYHPGASATVSVFRRDELMRFRVRLSDAPANTCYLAIDDDCSEVQQQRRETWLSL